jgi:hypothetical protein
MRNHRKINTFPNQDGMSGLGMVSTVAIVIVFVVLTLRLAPHYIDFQTLRAVMDDLPGPQVHEMEKRAILETLEKRFKINNLRSFTARDVVTIDRNKGGTTISVDYEIREPLLFNADIVLVFKETYSYQ